MLPLFPSFPAVVVFYSFSKHIKKNNHMFSDGLTMLGFHSNSTQESHPNEESNDSSDDSSADKLSTRKKMAQNLLFCADMTQEEASEQRRVINKKPSTQHSQNQHNPNHYPIFHLLSKFGNNVCSTRQDIAFWIQAFSFL